MIHSADSLVLLVLWRENPLKIAYCRHRRQQSSSVETCLSRVILTEIPLNKIVNVMIMKGTIVKSEALFAVSAVADAGGEII